jgi:dynein heavy chain
VLKLANFRKRIIESEKNILRLLADAKAEKILDDEVLISTLEMAKVTAVEIQEKIAESTILEEQIDLVRNSYRRVSVRGSILFFVIKDLSLIDPMYQYSLQYIARLFNFAMTQAEESKEHTQRLANLIDSITKIIYTNVTRGLFEAHKRIFSFLINISINKNAGIVKEALLSMLLRGAGVFDKAKQP